MILVLCLLSVFSLTSITAHPVGEQSESEPCIISKIPRRDSWDEFNPLVDANENETSYSIARCYGSDLSNIPSDIEVLYISGVDFSDSQFSLYSVLGRLPDLIAVAIDLSDLHQQMRGRLFQSNPNLQYVSITQCMTDGYLPAMFSRNTDLRVLKLASSGIRYLPYRFLRANTELQHVDFSQNMLRQIPVNTFSSNSKLTYLSLHSNRFTTLHSNLFSGLPMLETLDLSGNRLDDLPGNLFAGNTALKTVNLGANALTYLPSDLFSSNSLLREALFSNNLLEYLPRGLFGSASQLYIAYFGDNALPTLGLPNDLFDACPSIFFVDFRGNAGMLPELATKHHGITDEIKNMIKAYGYKEEDDFGE